MNFLPKAYEEDRDFWKEAAAASRAYLHSACHEKTGLSAEYADYDGKPHTGHKEIFGRHDWYYSDAYRTIANIAMDHLWFDADPWQIKTAERLQKFYCEDQKDNWDGVFLIDGTPLDEKALHPVAIMLLMQKLHSQRMENMQSSVLKSSGTLRLGQVTGDTMIISFTCLQC